MKLFRIVARFEDDFKTAKERYVVADSLDEALKKPEISWFVENGCKIWGKEIDIDSFLYALNLMSLTEKYDFDFSYTITPKGEKKNEK